MPPLAPYLPVALLVPKCAPPQLHLTTVSACPKLAQEVQVLKFAPLLDTSAQHPALTWTIAHIARLLLHTRALTIWPVRELLLCKLARTSCATSPSLTLAVLVTYKIVPYAKEQGLVILEPAFFAQLPTHVLLAILVTRITLLPRSVWQINAELPPLCSARRTSSAPRPPLLEDRPQTSAMVRHAPLQAV